MKTEVRVPDIGDFHDVAVIDVMVKAGDAVAAEQSLITIETDKAAMDVPAPVAGRLLAVAVKVGDKLNKGDLVCTVDAEATATDVARATPAVATPNAAPAAPATNPTLPPAATKPVAPPAGSYSGAVDVECQMVVLGSGPGGYAAAFRAADLGLKTAIVERDPVLGGVCLNVGCIPSKALLHAAKVIEDAHAMAEHGIAFGDPKIDLAKLRAFKDAVIRKSTTGLDMMAKQRKVEVVRGYGKFLDAHHLSVDDGGKKKVVRFEHCIIAAGSEPTRIPGLPDDPRIMDSTGALELRDVPKRLLVVGGGIIGLEMACVYDALGSKVTVVELTETLIPGADRDVVRPLEKRIKERYEAILLGTKVTAFKATKKGIEVTFDAAGKQSTDSFDRVLVAVGRRPNGKLIDAEKAGVTVDERGFVPSDKQMRTNVAHIHSIGDIRGNPMLAHKAAHEGHIAAEVAAGHKRFYDARAIPSIAYTDPEVAWVGLTEGEAKAAGIKVGKGVFPWAASGRARAMGQDAGQTKLLFDEVTHRLLGAACTGVNAGELLGELTLAIEMGASAEDIALTIHAHPTLHESVGLAAETFEGTVTDLYAPEEALADAGPVPVLDLADDTELPANVDAFVFEQDTDFILRVDQPLGYPKESSAELIAAAGQTAQRTPGMVYAIERTPLLLMAVVHDLAQEPSWRADWIAAAYAGIAYEVKERGLNDIVLPSLGTVHGRFDPVLSLAFLEAAMRAYRIDPRLWLRTTSSRSAA